MPALQIILLAFLYTDINDNLQKNNYHIFLSS